MPDALDEIVGLFSGSPKGMRLELLLDYANRLPPLPERFSEGHDQMEQVHECQTPFFVAADLVDGVAMLHFDALPEAPMTRGYASVLAEGLNGASAEEVLSVPNDFYVGMGLGELISPLRLRGMSAILGTVKRLIAQELETAPG